MFSLTCAVAASPASALTIDVVSADGPGEGFNDPTPVSPIGGNPRTTLGGQRLYALQYAADAWGARLGGAVRVVVSARFDEMGGTSVSAILGSAGPTTVHRDFTGAAKLGVWYVAPLANQLWGGDLNDIGVPGGVPELEASFNTSVDNPFVLGGVDFYYGLDGLPGSDIDFLAVALHEVAHGLGFLDLLDPDTGAKFLDFNDAYTDWLEDPTFNPSRLSMMTNPQRKQAMLSTGNLLWFGNWVKAASGHLTFGRRSDGRVQIYAPSVYESGSSTAHFDTVVLPNELMEPFATGDARSLRLTLALLKDLGWTTFPRADCGDPNEDLRTTAGDALFVLKGAVGSLPCPRWVCDVNFSLSVTAGDALALLKAAVGQDVPLACPLI